MLYEVITNLLREIQTATGGLTEFVPLGFIHERNILFNHMNARPGASMPEDRNNFV